MPTSEQDPWLRLDRPDVVEDFLRARRWIDADEDIERLERAGDGNMNFTARVVTDRRSVVLKQARPWVEKYPDVAAPVERGAVEAAFYRRVEALDAVARRMPRLLEADPDAHALLFEDLGATQDFTSIYGGAPPSLAELDTLAEWCTALHAGTRGIDQSDELEAGAPEIFRNRAMRELNHAHIFVLPLGDDLPLDLDDLEPGLGAAAGRLRADSAIRATVAQFARLYLDDGPCLVHGDYYPGSWMRTDAGPRILDPEFCFTGPPEFDVAVALAHLVLAETERSVGDAWMDSVSRRATFDATLVTGFAAIEVLRRLIGLAQLPLPAHTRRVAMLQRASAVLAEGPGADSWEDLWP